jgi:ornithine cyclodeaminase
MIILSNEDISELLSLPEIVQAVEEALIAYENGQASVPQRMHFDHGKNTLLCMPSFHTGFFGTKLVSVVPDNRDRALPVTNGAMLLNDAQTGLPLALLNASKLTALRTGALGAIAVKYLSPDSENTFGLIGNGVQGRHVAASICSVRKISKVFYLHRSEKNSVELLSFLKHHHPDQKVEACYSVEELLAKTNIVVTATTSASPVLPDDPDLLSGKHFIGIGSYKPSMQEFSDSVFKLTGELVIDSEFARHETGDILNPLTKGILTEENVFTIGKIILGKKKMDVTKTTAYKSAGMALFDLFVAQKMYEQAQRKKIGIQVSF